MKWITWRRAIFSRFADDLNLLLGKKCRKGACTQLLACSKRGTTAHFTMAVNVSARQFHLADFDDTAITRTIVAPAQSLGRSVIAEGVDITDP